jgi:hypothetical protein
MLECATLALCIDEEYRSGLMACSKFFLNTVTSVTNMMSIGNAKPPTSKDKKPFRNPLRGESIDRVKLKPPVTIIDYKMSPDIQVYAITGSPDAALIAKLLLRQEIKIPENALNLDVESMKFGREQEEQTISRKTVDNHPPPIFGPISRFNGPIDSKRKFAVFESSSGLRN